ncbi:MAG: hypothetical protein V9E90_04390 [Saprospiraceae bacterium]
MKPEEFDHRLNQKLDELHPVFEEKDWNRFYAKYQSQSTQAEAKSSNRKYLLLLLLLLFSIGVAYQMNAFQMLKGFLKIQEPVVSPILTETKPSSLEQQNVQEIQEASAVGKLTETNKQTSSVSGKMWDASSQQNQTVDKKLKRNQSTQFSQNQNVDLNNLRNTTNSNNKSSQTASGISSNESFSNKSEALSQTNFTGEAVIMGTGDIEKTATSEDEIQQVSEVVFLDNLELNPLENEFKPKLNAKFIKAVHSFKYSVGALALLTEKHFNQGIAFELKTKKYISFSTGLMRQAYFEQSYSDTYSFSETTADEFSELIKPRHSRSENIRNIRINANEWLLPLQLKYYLPFSSKYAAYFSGGIQLTLSSRVRMDFDYLSYVTQQEMSENDFDQASNRATLINQFNLGTGIQRSFNKLNCQLGVNLQKNNSNQSFINKYEPGIQLAVFYKI